MTLVALIGATAAIVLLHIEQSLGPPRMLPWIVAGAVVHGLLPLRFRMGLFLALGVGGLFGVFGPGGGAMVLVAGLTLIGACHLPLPHGARVAVVALLATALGALRLGWAEVAGAPMVLPMLGSMFMFRLIIYLYDLRHERRPVPVQARLAYFFMLPNLCLTRWTPGTAGSGRRGGGSRQGRTHRGVLRFEQLPQRDRQLGALQGTSAGGAGARLLAAVALGQRVRQLAERLADGREVRRQVGVGEVLEDVSGAWMHGLNPPGRHPISVRCAMVSVREVQPCFS